MLANKGKIYSHKLPKRLFSILETIDIRVIAKIYSPEQLSVHVNISLFSTFRVLPINYEQNRYEITVMIILNNQFAPIL